MNEREKNQGKLVNSEDIEEAKEKLRKEKTNFCQSEKIHRSLVEIMDSSDYSLISSLPVWVVPEELIGDKICIRPFGLIFVSQKVPLEFLEFVVYHEEVEMEYEEKLGRRRAHNLAIEKELEYLVKKNMLKPLLEWLKVEFPSIYKDRLKKAKKLAIL